MFRIIFAGTPEFAVPSLNALVQIGLKPSHVITQPDRKSGRGKKISTSAVKLFSEEHEIPVLQPTSIMDTKFLNIIKKINPDMIIVVAYGMIFHEELLKIPKLGCINIHASLLPRWRGASPIQSCIINGDLETGVTIMKMEKGLDNGPIYSQHKIKLHQTETADHLSKKLADLGAEAIKSNLKSILLGNIKFKSQNENKACYADKIKKSNALMDWKNSSKNLERHVRAFNSIPGAYFMYGDEAIKCWKAEAKNSNAKPGHIISADKRGIEVACGEGSLVILELQRPGKNRISAGEFCAQVHSSNKSLLSL
jgi:methionyl-tRNA formyltransferase